MRKQIQLLAGSKVQTNLHEKKKSITQRKINSIAGWQRKKLIQLLAGRGKN